MIKELWLFTMRYPFGVGEAFLENEVPVLCERFEKVRIFPEHRGDTIRPVPANAEVCLPVQDPFQRASFAEWWRYRSQALALLRSSWKDAPSFAVWWKYIPVLRNRISHLVHRVAVMDRDVLPGYDAKKTILYAYWFHDWVNVLGMSREFDAHVDLVSRAHGFDLFEAQNKDHWIPFRSFHLDRVSRVFCVSEAGRTHLLKAHPGHSALFHLSRLGTRDLGVGPMPVEGPLQLVSCSFLIPRKRVLRIVEALASMSEPVKWTHFGGGPQEPKIREAVSRLPAHVQVDLKGDTPNATIMKWYQGTAVDVLIHLSELEGGVPVAVQEAMSFGIPVIATDSGGVRDIMKPSTGSLIPVDAEASEVAGRLSGWRQGPMSTSSFRAGVRAAWAKDFEAGGAFHRFVDDLLAWKQDSLGTG